MAALLAATMPEGFFEWGILISANDPLDPLVGAVFPPCIPLRALIICGDSDELVPPAASRALADRFREPEFMVVEDGGHGLPPNSLLKQIASFVAGPS